MFDLGKGAFKSLLQIEEIDTHPAIRERAQDGSGHFFRLPGVVIVLLIYAFVLVFIASTGTRGAIGEFYGSAAILVRNFVTESNVSDLEVGRGSNNGRVTGRDRETPARCKVANTIRALYNT